jgi:alpha-glucosidase (family GH31 glycosyl hydrolase)
MVNIWARQGMRTLTYISPFFSDPSNFTSSEALHHNFYQEGIDNGYFVMKSNGTNQLIVYTLQSLSIQFCMLDVTNPSG